jgi:Kdo2-lipid IVA lauroyltransferase/acyltransferase
VSDATTLHRLEYALVVAVRGFVRFMPDAFARGLGTLVGLLFYAGDPAHRRLAIRQLRAAFPTRSEAECRAIARATFAHFGRLLVVLLRFSTLTPDAMRARVEFEGVERVRAALEAGKGAIIFTGHFGYWEIQGLAHALVLPPMSVLARPLDNPRLHALLEHVRGVTGNFVIYRRGSMRRVMRSLRANECVAMLIDQHISGSDAVRVDFFDRAVSTTSALAALALRTGAPVVPAFALPLPHGRYRLIYEHPVEIPPAASDDAVRDLTQRCTDVLEMYVRRHPHLWLWMHRRWRDPQDDRETVPGMFPAAVSEDREEPADV